MAIGSFIVLLSGGIDVSFSAIASIAAYSTGKIIIMGGGNLFYAFVLVIVIGIILGAVNGFLIYYLNAPTIVITIATMGIYYGLLLFITRGVLISLLPEYIEKFGNSYIFTFLNKNGVISGFSIFTLIWIVILIITWLILKHTMIGRSIFAMGSNVEGAKREGINILKLQLFIYSFMGLLAGIGGLVHTGLNQMIKPNALIGTELMVIAAVVIGGASLTGGSGTLLGTTLGVLLLAIISNGLTLAKVSSFWQNFVIGLILLVSVSITAYQEIYVKRKHIRVKIN